MILYLNISLPLTVRFTSFISSSYTEHTYHGKKSVADVVQCRELQLRSRLVATTKAQFDSTVSKMNQNTSSFHFQEFEASVTKD